MNYVHPTAIIGPNVVLGDDIYIGPHAVIGMHAESGNVDPRTARPGRVLIEDGVTIHELVTVQGSVSDGTTIIGPGSRIQAHAHVGHDATLGTRVTVACGAKIGGHATVPDYCNIGLNAVLHQRTVLPVGTMVGASAFAKGAHTDPWTIIAGVPARYIGPNTKGKIMHNQ